MRVAVIGAGNGGAASGVELTLAGHEVFLYGRSKSTIAPFLEKGISYQGVLGEGQVSPLLITSDLSAAIADAEVAIVALPTYAHSFIARALHAAGWDPTPPRHPQPGPHRRSV